RPEFALQMQGRTSIDPRWKSIHEDGSDFPGETHPSMVSLMTGEAVRNVVMGVFNPLIENHTWVNINAIPQFRPGENVPYQVYTTFEDITKKTKAEQALRESQSRLSNILKNAMDAIITVNEDQLLVMVNPAAERMFGFEGKDIVGRPLDELLPKRFRKKHPDLIRTFGQTDVTARNMGNLGILWGRRANREEFPIEVSISQVNASGGKFYTAIIRDITDRKHFETQIQESATLEERNRIARELHDSVTQS
ncbi:unnamed protein product, partial [marine sediment metagenome]